MENDFVWAAPEKLFPCINQLGNAPLFPGYYCRFLDETGHRIELSDLLLDPIKEKSWDYRSKMIVIEQDGTLTAIVEPLNAVPLRHAFRETPLNPDTSTTYLALQFFGSEEDGPIVKIPLEMGRLNLHQKRWQITAGETPVAQVERKIGPGYLVRLACNLVFLPNYFAKEFSSEELIGKEFDCEVIRSQFVGNGRHLAVVVRPISSFRKAAER